MAAFLITAAVGIVLVLLGIRIIKGDINAIHRYHRQRVSEEDQAAFGKWMGIGTVSCGAGAVSFGVLAIAAEWTERAAWMTAGLYLIGAGLAAGIGIMICTTIRLNKGIF